MKNHHLLLVVLLLLIISVPYISSAAGLGLLTHFGGRVTQVFGCNDGAELLKVQVPFQGVKSYMWRYTSMRYPSHVPPHIGQWLLGMVQTVETPCFEGEAYVGQGGQIMWYGSSL